GRLSNFNGTASPDPTLDPTYRDALIIACPTGDGNNRIALDVATPDDFDNAYYTDLVGNRGLLQSDQELFSTEGAETIAADNRFATNQSDFLAQFAREAQLGKVHWEERQQDAIERPELKPSLVPSETLVGLNASLRHRGLDSKGSCGFYQEHNTFGASEMFFSSPPFDSDTSTSRKTRTNAEPVYRESVRRL
ncbi:hypothetical protein SDJN02_27035, partial [Cucurbita argyrosperma subsp. argyrosperma]